MNRRLATVLLVSAIVLTGCAAPLNTVAPLAPASMRAELQDLPPGTPLLLGEQHDASDHQRMERMAVELLAGQGRLNALVLEMAERGQHTRDLPRHASESAVQGQLRWNLAGWPWERYGPMVMAAVRAGVPVLGGNLPRTQMRESMLDALLDQRVPGPVLQAQRQQIRDSHCGLLAETQVPGMARIQIARDLAMAETLAETVTDRGHVVLVAGGEHVRRDRGIPLHLPHGLAQRARVVLMLAAARDSVQPGTDQVWRSPALPERDYCAELRQSLQRPASP